MSDVASSPSKARPRKSWQAIKPLRHLGRLARLLFLTPKDWEYLIRIWLSGLFDRAYYREVNGGLHAIYQLFPVCHYILYGEAEGRAPNRDFVPAAYARLNPDLGAAAQRPFLHYLRHGRREQRLVRDFAEWEAARAIPWPVIRPCDLPQSHAPVAVHLHLYYHDLWPEFEQRLRDAGFDFDLYVTLTAREEDEISEETIHAAFPEARVWWVPNRGRDICPFMHLLNADVFAPYKAVAKLHGKRSLHRHDGDEWRQHLVGSILPGGEAGAKVMRRFLADRSAGILVADGQHYQSEQWWGANREAVGWLLARLELRKPDEDALSFPAGSIYWIKAEILDVLKGLQLGPDSFDLEFGQVDGTIAHALERTIGAVVEQSGFAIRQVSEPMPRPPARPAPPSLISAFYLPQFHPCETNDRFWGEGYTEWHAVGTAQPRFSGHQQPLLPSALGYYDLRVPEVMAAQTKRARDAGIGAFCVYHYWFDGQCLLDAPMRNLAAAPEVDFPFYLCWANESWRRNWDGLSGEILVPQSYQEGFERGLAASVAPYMRDPRYMRCDGVRPRFVIYRPEDLPDPEASIARLRDAFRDLGIGEVELGAVLFHLDEGRLAEDLFEFWVEMPPHGLVTEQAYLVGGERIAEDLPVAAHPGFAGLIYDYEKVVEEALSPERRAKLPRATIPGVMASWDNTARRGATAHMAWGATPPRFGHWVEETLRQRGAEAYRGELFINAWNEWGEKAVLEPSRQWGDSWLRALKRAATR